MRDISILGSWGGGGLANSKQHWQLGGVSTQWIVTACNLRIEGLEANIELRHLELQCNGITEIAGLSHLSQLEHLNLANNSIALVSPLKASQMQTCSCWAQRICFRHSKPDPPDLSWGCRFRVDSRPIFGLIEVKLTKYS